MKHKCTNDGVDFQVTLNGLEVMTFLVDRMKEDFRPYLSSVVPSVADRLGGWFMLLVLLSLQLLQSLFLVFLFLFL